MNIHRAITTGAKILKEKYVPNAHLDSEILMSEVIKKTENIFC